jgi:hypothetical protein
MATITVETTVVKDMLEGALESCAKKLGLKSGAHVRQLAGKGNCAICDSLCNEMAGRLAEYLGSSDDRIKAIYTYDPEYATSADGPVAGRPRMAPAINLLAWVSRKSGTLPLMVAMLSEALANDYRSFACSDANAPCYQLDVQVADDEEVRTRTGYGALVGSVHVQPIEVWRR